MSTQDISNKLLVDLSKLIFKWLLSCKKLRKDYNCALNRVGFPLNTARRAFLKPEKCCSQFIFLDTNPVNFFFACFLFEIIFIHLKTTFLEKQQMLHDFSSVSCNWMNNWTSREISPPVIIRVTSVYLQFPLHFPFIVKNIIQIFHVKGRKMKHLESFLKRVSKGKHLPESH